MFFLAGDQRSHPFGLEVETASGAYVVVLPFEKLVDLGACTTVLGVPVVGDFVLAHQISGGKMRNFSRASVSKPLKFQI
jgi:hypothetical protein